MIFFVFMPKTSQFITFIPYSLLKYIYEYMFKENN